MSWLIDAALGRGRMMLVALALILVVGYVAYDRIAKESNPDVNIPIIYVSMTLEGISPEDSERLLLRPMEKELRTIEGVKEMRSTGFEGGGNVILEFEAGFDADKALEDVRQKVDLAKPELPAEAEEPRVNEVNLSLFPVLVVTLSGEVPERTLLRLARDLRDRIESIPSVLKATIAGDREELVEIIIDPLLVESYGLSVNEVLELVNRSNRLIAAGSLDTGRGRFAIKVPGLFQDVRDILTLPVRVNGDAVVTVGDIATVRKTFKDPTGFARLNGKPAIALEISKRTGENIIATIDEVRRVVEAERTAFPPTVDVAFSADESINIRTMLTDMQNSLTMAVLLVLIIVVASLGLRSTALVSVAIVGSFLAGILVLAGLGQTMNVVVLFGLIFAAGNVVDGAIVVTEYAERRMEEGMGRAAAYAFAARRMAWPIIASTATQIAAFLPLLFWPGIVGEFMKYLPITQVATLSASVLMALIFVPVLGAFMGRRVMVSSAPVEVPPDALTRSYLRLLQAALRRPATILILAIAALVGTQWYYVAHGNGVEFFPKIEPDRAQIQVHARGNLSVREQDALVREVEARILAMDAEHDEFKTVYTRSGGSNEFGRDQAEDVIGSIALEFAPWQTRRPASEIMAEIRRRSADLAGIVVEPRQEQHGPHQGKPIQVQVGAREPELIPAALEPIVMKIRAMEGVVDVEDGRPLPGIEWQINVDRAQAAKFGADVSTIGSAVRLVTNGLKLGAYRPDESDDEVDIVARFPTGYRSLDQLDQIRVQTPQGLVPISNFVARTPEHRVGRIDRVDGKRVMTIKADVAPGVLADDKVREIQAFIAEARLDPRLDVRFKGEDEEQKKAQAFLSNAFGVALFLIAIILLAQFNSFYSTFLILSAVVMSTVGVFIGLIVTGQPFGIIMTGIGVVSLAGIVVNNNIVLIDTFDQLRQTARSDYEAILQTGRERLRPVLLTAFNTVIGLMPLMLAVNIDFLSREVSVGAPSTQWWIQLSTAIVFGLTFATVLTLVLTPCALMLRANVRDAWRRRRGFATTPAVTIAEPAASLRDAAE